MVDERPEERPEQRPGETGLETEAEHSETPEASQASETGEIGEQGAPAESVSASGPSSGASATEPAAEPPVADAPQTEGADPAAAGLTLGTSPPAEIEQEIEAPKAAPVIRGRIDRFGVAMGTGRRKTAVARVRVKEGNGKLRINGKPLTEYFHIERDQAIVEAPLQATEMQGKVDVWVRVNGGGPSGQAGAIVLGIARALQAMDPELHHALSDGGYLTRDGRMVERKKYGFKKARRSFQFSKR